MTVVLLALCRLIAALRTRKPVVRYVSRHPDPRVLDGAVVVSAGRRWVLVDRVLIRLG